MPGAPSRSPALDLARRPAPAFGRIGLNVQLPSAALVTSGDVWPAAPGASCGAGAGGGASLAVRPSPPAVASTESSALARRRRRGASGASGPSAPRTRAPSRRARGSCPPRGLRYRRSSSARCRPSAPSAPSGSRRAWGSRSSRSCEVSCAAVSSFTWFAWSAMKCAFGLSCLVRICACCFTAMRWSSLGRRRRKRLGLVLLRDDERLLLVLLLLLGGFFSSCLAISAGFGASSPPAASASEGAEAGAAAPVAPRSSWTSRSATSNVCSSMTHAVAHLRGHASAGTRGRREWSRPRSPHRRTGSARRSLRRSTRSAALSRRASLVFLRPAALGFRGEPEGSSSEEG